MLRHFLELPLARACLTPDLDQRGRRYLDKHFIVGPVLGADSTTPSTGRQGKTGEAITGFAHGKYYEPASRGVLFAACDQGAGVAVTATITTTCIFSLHNPLATQKRLAIKKVSVGYVSGTLGAGSLLHAINPVGTTLPTSGTLLASTCLDIGNQSGVVAVGVVRTASTVVAAVAVSVLGSLFPELATTANAMQVVTEDLDGMIVLEPGGIYQLVGVMGAAGTTPKVSVGIVWEEIPIVASNG